MTPLNKRRLFVGMLSLSIFATTSHCSADDIVTNNKIKETKTETETAGHSTKDEPSKPLVAQGDTAPDFSATTTDNKQFSLSANLGKVIVLDFFATWCPPCRQEIPHLEKDLWQHYKRKGVVVLLLGREHNLQELAEFKDKEKLTMAVAADPKREIYSKYAKETIPRTFVIGKDGKILFDSVGFQKRDFHKLIKTVSAALASRN